MNHVTQTVVSRPLPVPDADSAPFWEACRERRLVVQECSTCGKRRFPPIGLCHRCRGWEFEWVQVEQGTVYSWIVVHQSPVASLQDEVPYVAAVIDLGDGVRMPTQLVGVEPDGVAPGMPVTLHWQEVEGAMVLPYFKPVES